MQDITFQVEWKEDVAMPKLHRSPIVLMIHMPEPIIDTPTISITVDGTDEPIPSFIRSVVGNYVKLIFQPLRVTGDEVYNVDYTET